MTTRPADRLTTWARTLLLALPVLVALWFLHPYALSLLNTNLGAVRLNRALLAPDLPFEERAAHATRAGKRFVVALTWYPRNGSAYYNLAGAYLFWDNSSGAADALSQAVALAPQDTLARFRLGLLLAERGEEERAVELWREAGVADYFIQQGNDLAGQGDLEGALIAYRRATEIAPLESEGYERLGRTLSRLGQREEALVALETSAALAPSDSPRRYRIQAEVHVAREEWESALAAYGRAAELLPDDPEPLYRRGHLLAHTLGRPVEAIDDFRRALERDPDHAPARRELGAVYLEAGSCDAAARTLLPLLASERDAGAAATYAGLGTCFLDGGQGGEALLYLEEAVRLAPTSVPYRLSLARALVEVERYTEAIAAYREVLGLEPENAEAREALDALGGSEP